MRIHYKHISTPALSASPSSIKRTTHIVAREPSFVILQSHHRHHTDTTPTPYQHHTDTTPTPHLHHTDTTPPPHRHHTDTTPTPHRHHTATTRTPHRHHTYTTPTPNRQPTDRTTAMSRFGGVTEPGIIMVIALHFP